MIKVPSGGTFLLPAYYKLIETFYTPKNKELAVASLCSTSLDLFLEDNTTIYLNWSLSHIFFAASSLASFFKVDVCDVTLSSTLQ